MMTTLLRLLLVVSVISRLGAAAGVEVDKDFEDILVEEVGDGGHGNNSSSDIKGKFDDVKDKELSVSFSSSSLAFWQIFLIVLVSVALLPLVLVGLCFCCTSSCCACCGACCGCCC